MTKEELIKLSRENLRKSKQGSLCECYDEAFIKGYELSEKQIAELEKENKVLAQNLEDTEIVNKALEKENAELKEENKKWKDEWQEQVQKANDEGYARTLQTMQLTKAKEIIKNLVEFDSSYKDDEEYQRKSELYDKMREEAEQFIKDSEVKK